MRVTPLGVVLAVVGLATVAAVIAYGEFSNFRAVSPGRCYRSGRLDRGELITYARKHGIRTVINLRGANSEEDWYIEEKQVCREFEIAHHDIPLKSTAEPTRAQVAYLIDLFKHSEEPLLLHCNSGIDRVGLASALWLMVMENADKEVARKQLSLRYGYLPILGKGAMGRFIDRWQYPAKSDGRRPRPST